MKLKGSNVSDELLKFARENEITHVSSASPLVRDGRSSGKAPSSTAWALAATSRGLTELVQRMKHAEDLTRKAESTCNLEELLVLSGQNAEPVVARIVPRLVKKEQTGVDDSRRVQWVPDNLARAFVENLAITGSTVRALENYTTIDNAYKAMALPLATAGIAFVAEAGGAATAAGYILVAGDAVDIAVFGVRGLELYKKGETQYELARGAAPILGQGFLEEADAARQSGLMTALGLIAPGLAGVSCLKQISNLRLVQRRRDLLTRPNLLASLTELDKSDQFAVAAFYADLHRRGAKGLSKLSATDRVAFNKFQNHFDRAGLPKTDTAPECR